MDVLYITEQEARKALAENSKKSSSSTPVIIKDFGVLKGEKLDIRQGPYGYYMKHGDKNIRLDGKYQHDEQACKAMSEDEALAYIKK